MKLVLFRHAQKGIMPFDDPELSPQGFQQSLQLTNLIKNATLPQPTQLLVSPKRRTSQTFYPTSKEFSLSLKINPDLDQRNNEESSSQFRQRVQDFLNAIEDSPTQEIVFVCTHFDWIEEAMTMIECDKNLNSFEFSHWSPTQFLVFEIEKSIWKVLRKGDAK